MGISHLPVDFVSKIKRIIQSTLCTNGNIYTASSDIHKTGFHETHYEDENYENHIVVEEKKRVFSLCCISTVYGTGFLTNDQRSLLLECLAGYIIKQILQTTYAFVL